MRPAARASAADRFVTPAWLAGRLDDPDVVVVDGSWYLPAMHRDPDAEYRAGHIPGAVRVDVEAVRDRDSTLPHMLPTPEAFAAAMGELGIAEDMTVVVYDGAGLFSAPRVWWMLTVFGARDVRILDGGLPGWTAAGHPVQTGAPPTRSPRTFRPRFDRSAVADLGDVQQAVRNGSAQVLDARSAERFRGDAPEPRPGVRSGHIPGSRNLPYSAVLVDGRLADPQAITAAVRAAGIDPAEPVITSCGSGVTAAILWLALDAIGHPPRSIYDGSWTEWGGRSDVPAATGDP
jgi:thiosulfate/3-mercaptopyruvate sulfurtransferase